MELRVLGRKIIVLLIIVCAISMSFARCSANEPLKISAEETKEKSDEESHGELAKTQEEFARSMLSVFPGRKIYLVKMRYYETSVKSTDKEPEQRLITRWALWTPQDATFSSLSCSEVALSKFPSKVHQVKPHSVGLVINGIIGDRGNGNICIKTKSVAKKEIDMIPSSLELPNDAKEVVTNAKLNEPAKFQLTPVTQGLPLQWWCEMVVTEVVK